MVEQKIFIIDLESLYDIFNEVKNSLNFKIFQINLSEIDVRLADIDENSIFLINDITKINKFTNLDTNKVLELNNLPISFLKLIEKINLLFLKINYQSKSEVKIKNYSLNLNDRSISKENKNTKLTEKELEIILYLSNKKKPKTIIELQNEIWKYNSDLETHTVETHVYRLRKKIQKIFEDQNFILSSKDGYYL